VKERTRGENRTNATGQTRSPLSGQPPWWLIVLTAALALADRLVLLTHEPKLVVAANTWEPLVLGVALGFVALRLFVGRPSSAWTAYAWSLLSLMAFFCVGPLIYAWGGPEAVKYALSFLPLNERDLLRTNLLTALGMLSYFLGVRLVSFWQGPRLGEGTFRFTTRPRLLALAVTFLVIGAVLNIAVMYPYDLQLSNRIYPGVLINLGDTYLLGLTILVYLVAKGDKRLLVPLALLWLPQLFVTLVSFNKGQLLLSILIPALGAYLARPRFGRLALTAVLVVMGLFFGERFALWGRIEYDRIHPQPHRLLTALIARGTLAADYFAISSGVLKISSAQKPVRLLPHLHLEKPKKVKISSVQKPMRLLPHFHLEKPKKVLPYPGYALAWGRLNYAAEEWFAMNLYDHGRPGHTLKPALYIFIPRLLWPQKPDITEEGNRFYALATHGGKGTSLGLGIFGEGYWNGGWSGVVGLSFLTGIILGIMSILSTKWIEEGAFQYLPSILIGVLAGQGSLVGLFVTFVMGPAGFFAAYAVLSAVTVYGLTFSRRTLEKFSFPLKQHD
jgi:hypothetical protein